MILKVLMAIIRSSYVQIYTKMEMPFEKIELNLATQFSFKKKKTQNYTRLSYALL